MTVVLWPRQEVLQLIIPQLGSVSKHLTYSLVSVVAKNFLQTQTSDGLTSFDNWSSVAKEKLKWNDSCVQLFWDMLLLAITYLTPEITLEHTKETNYVPTDCLIIFLVLHILDKDTTGKSHTTVYESVWPLNSEGEVYPSSPVASPSSPTREKNRARAVSPMNSSPRSPRNSPQKPNSPMSQRSYNSSSSARTPRASTQYLHSVRARIPWILQVLSPADKGKDEYNSLSRTSSDDYSIPSMNELTLHYPVTRKTVDLLGLIVCGGHSRDQSSGALSSLHPTWCNTEDSTHSMNTRAKEGTEYGAADNSSVLAKDLLDWINMHLSMNDLLYPVSLSPSIGAIGSSPLLRDPNNPNATPQELGSNASVAAVSNSNAQSTQHTNNHPHKVVHSMQSLSRFAPTVINQSANTTIIHVLASSSSRTSSFRSRNNNSNSNSNSGRNAHSDNVAVTGKQRSWSCELSDSEMESSGNYDFAVSMSGDTLQDLDLNAGAGVNNNSVSNPPSPNTANYQIPADDIGAFKYDLTYDPKFQELINKATLCSGSQQLLEHSTSLQQRPHATLLHEIINLPQLFANYCLKSRIYALSAYYSASITGCSDCEIVLGAVFGAVIVSGCERVKVTAACRKLIVMNCLECEFQVATLTPSIIVGDCRSIVIGPYNTNYRNLKNHLKLAHLSQLRAGSSQVNLWASLCDVNLCLDSSANNASNANHTPQPALMSNNFDSNSSSYRLSLPTPPSSTAVLQPPDKFRAIAIPVKAEYQPFENVSIALPREFSAHLEQVRSNLEQVKHTFLQALASQGEHSQQTMENNLDLDTKLLSSSLLAKNFMDWMVANNCIHEVLDLIKIDQEKGNHQ